MRVNKRITSFMLIGIILLTSFDVKASVNHTGVCGVHNTGYYRVLSDGTIEYVSNGAARIVPLNYSLFQEKKNEGIALYY